MPKKVDAPPPSRAEKLSWLAKRIKEASERECPPGMTMLGAPFITKWYKDVNMAQIYSSGLEYAFVSKEGEQCHAFAYCKDFLQDAVWATLNKSSASIYGFTYQHGVNPAVDTEHMRLGVRIKGAKGEGFEEKCKKALVYLQEIDAVQGFAPTELLLGGKKKGEKHNTYVFVADKAWLHSSVMVSLFSLLVRVGMTYEGGGWRKHFDGAKTYLGSKDKSYTASAAKGLDKIIGKKPDAIFAKNFIDNYPKGVNVNAMHNSSGIVAYAKGIVNSTVKSKWSK